jgi:glycosyltransferase involved in cell wall biosynthesis
MANVLIFASSSSGVLYFRMQLIEELLRLGHKVWVLAPCEVTAHSERIRETGASFVKLELERASINPLGELWVLLQVRRVLIQIECDSIIAYSHKPILYSLIAGLGVPRVGCWGVLCGLGYAYSGGGLRRKLLRLLLRVLYTLFLGRISGLILLNSDDSATLSACGVPIERVSHRVIMGEGVDTEFFASSPVRNEDCTTFCMISRLIADKGVGEYLAAAFDVVRGGSNARFQLAGPFDENPTAISKGEIFRYCQSGVVEYLGVLDDVRPTLGACSVLVLPSYREGMPRVVLEAMSMGRAIITTNVPGCRETIWMPGEEDQDGVRVGLNGFLVRAQSVHSLSAAMKLAISNPELVRCMGRQGTRVALERFSAKEINRSIIDFLGLGAK